MSQESDLHYDVSPREIFRRQVYACSFFERRNIVATIEQIGADNIMFETDFPHPASIYPAGPQYLGDAIDEMSSEQRFKFFSGNAARVYNIDLPDKLD
jgi:predicted TIM-barrel fold metal-dependent hydrolase